MGKGNVFMIYVCTISLVRIGSITRVIIRQHLSICFWKLFMVGFSKL
jgi:hypothetical protein